MFYVFKSALTQITIINEIAEMRYFNPFYECSLFALILQ